MAKGHFGPALPLEREEDRGLGGLAFDERPALAVDLGTEAPTQTAGGVTITHLPNGTIAIDFGGGSRGLERPTEDADDHDVNLAEFLDEKECARIGREVVEGVEADLRSRAEWQRRLADGLELLGVREPTANLGVFAIAKKINHPVIAEAAVQFQARAIAELFPSAGPAKAVALGDKTKELEAQAERVADYLNYQLVFEDRAYFDDFDQMLFMLALEGSQFKKAYRDPVARKNRVRWVRVENFVVPYAATSLSTASRYAEIIYESANTVRKKQVAGDYRDVELGPPSVVQGGGIDQDLRDAADDLEGRSNDSVRPEDAEYMMYEAHLELDVEGFEHAGEDGQPTGVMLPYVATVERDTNMLLSLRRNWKRGDPTFAKRIWYTHYKYLPGPGFYGLGLLHILGGLGAAATGVLRSILVSGAFAGAGGGFKTKEARMAGAVTIEPGVFKETDCSYDDLKKGFWQPDFKGPDTALFSTLGHLLEAAQRFASTTENQVGDAKNTGPVGTTVALIEQGAKVFSGIHKRCHAALGWELTILAQLNGEYLPDDEAGYPYHLPGASRTVFARDFDDRVDVAPVSDPNIFSSTQRVAIAQSTLDLSTNAPDLFDRREANRRMLEALRVSDIDRLMPDKSIVPRADAVTENGLCIVGAPIKVFMDQDDEAHNIVHGQWIEQAKAQGLPSQVIAVMQSHMAEHESNRYRKSVAAMAGTPIVPMNLSASGGQSVVPDLPPEAEAAITRQAAQAVAARKQQEQQQQKDPAVVEVEGRLQLAREKQAGELDLKRSKEAALMKIAEAKAKHALDLASFTAEQTAKLKQRQATLDAALAHDRMVMELALKREADAARMEQEGQAAEAAAERESIDKEKREAKGSVGEAQSALAEAVAEIARGMDALSTRLNDTIESVAASLREPEPAA